MIQATRSFFFERQYLEVDTPIRIPAPAPEAHIDAVASEDCYLQTSPELCMKQLVAAGYSRIFQICKCFRNKERGRKHLPELTMLEWYKAGGNYTVLMDDCQELIGYIAGETTGNNSLRYQGQTIHLDPPWTRMSVDEAFRRYAKMEVGEALAKDCFEEVMVNEIEPNLGTTRPLFLFDYPASLGALARLKPENRRVAERFELYIAGIELCNGFSELTDPVEQRRRFKRHAGRLRQCPGPRSARDAARRQRRNRRCCGIYTGGALAGRWKPDNRCWILVSSSWSLVFGYKNCCGLRVAGCVVKIRPI